MDMQAVTVELPARVYQVLRGIADLTGRPVASVLQTSLAHTLPPLEDVPADEAADLAALALLDDGDLWRAARALLNDAEQAELHDLLDRQNAGLLTSADHQRLQSLLDAYAWVTLRKAHAYLLLARRGYRVPMQSWAE